MRRPMFGVKDPRLLCMSCVRPWCEDALWSPLSVWWTFSHVLLADSRANRHWRRLGLPCSQNIYSFILEYAWSLPQIRVSQIPLRMHWSRLKRFGQRAIAYQTTSHSTKHVVLLAIRRREAPINPPRSSGTAVLLIGSEQAFYVNIG
jgi:hypothetical protein